VNVFPDHGLDARAGIAVSGSNLFVTNFLGNTIGEYTTSGATVNASLITGLNDPAGIVVLQSWLVEKLGLFPGSRVIIHNEDGKFNIQSDDPLA